MEYPFQSPGYQTNHPSRAITQNEDKTNAKPSLTRPKPLLLLPTRRLGLLLDVELGPALLRLAGVVPVLVLGLLGAVARQARHGAAHGARHALAHPGRVVVDLPARLLLLARAVLLAAGLLERLQDGQ